MSEMDFEARLHALADRMDYPLTPDIAGRVVARLRPAKTPRIISKAAAWSLAIILVLVSSLMLIPRVRAAVIDFFQVGIVRIFPPSATPTAQTITTATPESMTPSAATPGPTLPSLLPLLDTIAGETNLANAQEITGYPILLPTHPPDLGLPDRVYIQDADGAMTILVWVDPQQPERVLLSLHFIPKESWAIKKMGPRMIQETRVNGRYAIWAEGPYPLWLRGSSDIEFVRLVEGHVLIWEGDGITYRLESDLGMEEVIRVAESLGPIP